MSNNNKVEISASTSEKINIFRALLIILVVFFHSYTDAVNVGGESVVFDVPDWLFCLKYIISQIVGNCAVPGFFLVSSFLLYKKDFNWLENMKRKVKSLLVPYVILNFVWIIIFFVAQHIPALSYYFSSEENIIANWGVVNWLNAFLGFNSHPMLYPLWFLRDLFVMNFLSKLIKKLVDCTGPWLLPVLAVFWVWGFETHIFFINRQALAFFVAGYYVVKYYDKIILFVHRFQENKFALVLTIIYVCMGALDYTTRGMKLFGIVDNEIIHNIGIIVGVVFLYYSAVYVIYKNNGLRKTFLWIGGYSFGIYLFHEIGLSSLKKISVKLFQRTAMVQLLEYIVIPVIIIAACLVFCSILKKYLPKVYRLLTGSR